MIINLLLLQTLTIAENFAARLAQVNLASKSDNVNFQKKTNFDDKLKKLNNKINSTKTKHILVKNEFKKSTNIWLKSLY